GECSSHRSGVGTALKGDVMSDRLVGWVRIVGVAVACLLANAPSLLAQDADILGSWDVTVSAGQGPETSAPLVLKREGDQIVGTFSSLQGDQGVEAHVKDKPVTIWFSVRTQNGPISITMKGTAEGDTMRGSMDFGGRGPGRWSRTRAAGRRLC